MSDLHTRRAAIINRKGLHARASAKLAKLALTLPVKVTIEANGETADACSIMDLLCLGAGLGETVTLSATGPDAPTALTTLTALFADGFGELDEPAED